MKVTTAKRQDGTVARVLFEEMQVREVVGKEFEFLSYAVYPSPNNVNTMIHMSMMHVRVQQQDYNSPLAHIVQIDPVTCRETVLGARISIPVSCPCTEEQQYDGEGKSVTVRTLKIRVGRSD